MQSALPPRPRLLYSPFSIAKVRLNTCSPQGDRPGRHDKGHQEFHGVDMKQGFHNVPGYPWGFSEKILAGSLDEKNKVGNRTRILKIEAGAFSTVPLGS